MSDGGKEMKKLNVENCRDCKKSTPNMKTYPYCSKKHWEIMVCKH